MSFHLHFLLINGNRIYLQRDTWSLTQRSFSEKKFRSRVRAVEIISANCKSHLKSEFTVRCDWCRNSPWENEVPGWTRRADYASARAASAEQAGQCQGVPLWVLLFPVIPTEPISLSYEIGGFTSRDARDELSYYTTNITWHSEFIERVFRCDGLIPACE